MAHEYPAANCTDFLSFAESHNYPRQRGFVSWLMVQYTAEGLRGITAVDGDHPHLRYSSQSTTEEPAIDLWSAYQRLRASRLSPDAWQYGTKLKVEFLAHLVNGRLQPAESLPLTRRDAIRTYRLGETGHQAIEEAAVARLVADGADIATALAATWPADGDEFGNDF